MQSSSQGFKKPERFAAGAGKQPGPESASFEDRNNFTKVNNNSMSNLMADEFMNSDLQCSHTQA